MTLNIPFSPVCFFIVSNFGNGGGLGVLILLVIVDRDEAVVDG